MDELRRILELINLSHNLKTEGRHCWYADGRRESVAEHVYCMALMAMVLGPKLSKPVNMERLLKIILVHDLVEAEVGDVPFFLSTSEEQKLAKAEREQMAIEKIRDLVPGSTGEEIYALWQEYETKSSFEALVAKALDKLESNIQHNDSPLETWTQMDRERAFEIGHFCAVDPILEELNRLVEADSSQKLHAALS